MLLVTVNCYTIKNTEPKDLINNINLNLYKNINLNPETKIRWSLLHCQKYSDDFYTEIIIHIASFVSHQLYSKI